MSDDVDRAEAAQLRAAFFARTRKTVAFLYAVATVLGLAAGVAALAIDAFAGLVAFAVVGVVLIAAFGLGRRLAIPRAALPWLSLVGAAAGVAIARSVDLPAAVVLGGLAGVLLGMVVGIWLVRRRLAVDDALIVRQRRLGYLDDR